MPLDGCLHLQVSAYGRYFESIGTIERLHTKCARQIKVVVKFVMLLVIVLLLLIVPDQTSFVLRGREIAF